jgi:hypothetical protein
MAENILVLVRAGEDLFGISTSFARVPVPGEHIFLWLNEDQRARLGAEFGRSKATPAIVRDTVLLQMNANRWSPPGMKDHHANVFVEAITAERWRSKMGRWALGSEEP